MDLGLNYVSGGNPPDYYKPLKTIPWGIFNLNTIPVLILDVYEYCYLNEYQYWTCRDELYYKSYKLQSAPSLSYPTDATSGLNLISKKFAYIYKNQKPTAFYNFHEVKTFEGNSRNYPVPEAIAIELTFRTSAPTKYFDDVIVIYKTYPIKVITRYENGGDNLSATLILGKKPKITAYPNTFVESTNLHLSIFEDQFTNISIHNANGKKIRQITNKLLIKGNHNFEWDGKDSSGKEMPRGTYYCRIACGTEEKTIRIIKE